MRDFIRASKLKLVPIVLVINPGSITSKSKPLVIVTGCVAQAEHTEMLKREPYIDLILGPQAYHKINDMIINYQKENKKI